MKIISAILCALMIAGCYSREPRKTGLEGQPIPEIDLLMADSTTHFSTTELSGNKPVLLFAFEPWCPYCRAQTADILEDMDQLKDMNIVMLTFSPYAEFKDYYEKYGLAKYPNIIAGIDIRYAFEKYFGISQIPCMAVYGKDNKLKQVMVGKRKVRSIVNIAAQ